MKIYCFSEDELLQKRLNELLQNHSALQFFSEKDDWRESFKNQDPTLVLMDLESINRQLCADVRQVLKKIISAKKISRIPIIGISSDQNIEKRSEWFRCGGDELVDVNYLEERLFPSIKQYVQGDNDFLGCTALVVDDEEDGRIILQEILEERGVNVITASDGIEAYEILREKSDHIDIVLTDFRMPEMNGIQLCQKIRQQLFLQHLPVIFITAATEKETIINLFKAGASDYLVKPFYGDELWARLSVHYNNALNQQNFEEQLSYVQQLTKVKDNFLAVCGHDLMTPLNLITGYTDILLDEKLTTDQLEYLKKIKRAGIILSTLITELLDITQMEIMVGPPRMDNVDFLQVVDKCVAEYSYLAELKDIEMRFHHEIKFGTMVFGNEMSLSRIVSNLLSNALKYSHKKSEVKVTLENESERSLSLTIQDFGVGIPDQRLDSIFERVENQGQMGTCGETSTGIGLSIVKEQVLAHQGSVEVESQVGKGSTFILKLPLSV